IIGPGLRILLALRVGQHVAGVMARVVDRLVQREQFDRPIDARHGTILVANSLGPVSLEMLQRSSGSSVCCMSIARRRQIWHVTSMTEPPGRRRATRCVGAAAPARHAFTRAKPRPPSRLSRDLAMRRSLAFAG